MNNILTRSRRISVVFVCLLLLAATVSAQISLRTAIDYDGDGRADYPIYVPSQNAWVIYQSSGTAKVQVFGLANEDTPTPGDFDGDGKGDIAAFRDSNGVWMRLNSFDNTFVAIQFGQTGDEPIARRYDSDNKTDLALVRRTNGVMTWFVFASTINNFYGIQHGLPTDFTAPGDYDGDGRFDLAIQRPGATPTTQSQFWIIRSSDGGVRLILWGVPGDLPVPGDYDDDGITDVAIVREGATPDSPLVWWVLRSSDGAHTTTAFGNSSTDLTTQNDYDGDGVTDISIWRSTEAIIYVLRSSDGGFYGVRWGTPTDIPIAAFDTH